MAQWIQTPEPYVKVHEIVKSVPLNPRAGEDLIIGVVLISDAGPSVPTLINNQSEFLSTYSSKDLTQDYLGELKNLYTGSDKEMPATVWENVYRLAGSNSLLVCRASKADGIYFSKPLVKGDLNTYILRDGLLLKKLGSFKLVIDSDSTDGWVISISGVGLIGNLTTDKGAQYDYYVNSLPDLVDQLNESSKFFSPSFTYYSDEASTVEVLISEDSTIAQRQEVKSVVFNEVYLGSQIIDTTDPRLADLDNNLGYAYIIPCLPESTEPDQSVIDLNSVAWSGFDEIPYYATNQFNSATELKVRIRRFNHDAVINKTLSDNEKKTLNPDSSSATGSPYTVLTSVLDTFTEYGTKDPDDSILERDFFEIAVLDPSVNDEVSFFNIGNIPGRGDMEVSEVNSLISMIQLQLPDDLHDLGLGYCGYRNDSSWKEITPDEGSLVSAKIPVYDDNGLQIVDNTTTEIWCPSGKWEQTEESPKGTVATYEDLNNINPLFVGDVYYVEGGERQGSYKFVANKYYIYVGSSNEAFADLTIDPTKYDILKVSDSDLKKALDKIILDEVYVTEALSDGGNTEPSYQSYMANYAINENYFYAVSTVNSTNYMTIGNSIQKLSQDSYKLYASAPWDIDTGTFGWKFYASPAVLYWEAVSRNRRNNEEFRAVMGQVGGIMQYQRPTTEFNKKTRELLLSRKVNTVKWNIQTQAWNMNNNFTKTSVDNIMQDEANSRLAIRIAKAMPRLLWQYIGRQISEVMCSEMRGTIDYFFKTTILPMTYTVEAYQIFCNYDADLARQNRVRVVVNVRFYRTLKYVDVYDVLFDTGMDITEPGYGA